jgi:predicted RNA-binding Zn ribbon-like protein
LVESFLNSIDLESGRDDLDSPVRFRGWLIANGRAAAAESVTPADLWFAREVRDALREEVRGHGVGDHSRLNALAAHVALCATFTSDGLAVRPAEPGVRGVIGEVLGAAVIADRDGRWQRLKICRERHCQVAFYDRSKNSSRCWCSMSVCGNRNKTRAYRGRRRIAAREARAAALARETRPAAAGATAADAIAGGATAAGATAAGATVAGATAASATVAGATATPAATAGTTTAAAGTTAATGVGR